jgi:hypothetical protein
MGYELDEIQEVIIYDKDSGKEIGRLKPGQIQATEENSKLAYSSSVFEQPPKPNIKFIISPGQKNGQNAVNVCFYRPKQYNWFQRFMYKICFGITIKQGNEVRREFL